MPLNSNQKVVTAYWKWGQVDKTHQTKSFLYRKVEFDHLSFKMKILLNYSDEDKSSITQLHTIYHYN